MSNDKDEWKEEIVRSAEDINRVATVDFLDTHSDNDIRDEYNSSLCGLYMAAYEYVLRGGYVKIVAGDVLASYMRYETRCDICPVTLKFEKLA